MNTSSMWRRVGITMAAQSMECLPPLLGLLGSLTDKKCTNIQVCHVEGARRLPPRAAPSSLLDLVASLCSADFGFCDGLLVPSGSQVDAHTFTGVS